MNHPLNELFTALAKAQAEMRPAGLNAENPFFKSSYADLTEIVRASRPALTKNGLSVLQVIVPEGEFQYLHTILGHSSGQYIESKMKISPAKSDIQSMGGYITYLRRYCYAAIVGVVISGEDDDGNSSMVYEKPKGDLITDDQLDQLENELAGHPDIAKKVLEGLNIKSLSHMPKNVFLSSLNRIRTIKSNQ